MPQRIHYLAHESGQELVAVESGVAFAEDGTNVIVVGLSDGALHFFNLGESDEYAVLDSGVLEIGITGAGAPLRVYGAWTFVERRSYKVPDRQRAQVR